MDKDHMRQQKQAAYGLGDDLQCGVCCELATRPVFTPCAHLFCARCIGKLIDLSKKPLCPKCRSSIQEIDILELEPIGPKSSRSDQVEASRILATQYCAQSQFFSSKVQALIKYIKHIQGNDENSKSLVYSSFPEILDLVSHALRFNDIRFLRLKGNAKRRAAIVNRMQDPDTPEKVFLLSLQSDSSGLTLTMANNVFLLEPSTNFALEDQAVHRVHRRGQLKPTTCYRFIMKNSIEEHLVDIQQRSRRLQSDQETHLRGGLTEELSKDDLLKIFR